MSRTEGGRGGVLVRAFPMFSRSPEVLSARWASAVRRPTKRFRGAFCVVGSGPSGVEVAQEIGSSVDIVVFMLSPPSPTPNYLVWMTKVGGIKFRVNSNTHTQHISPHNLPVIHNRETS